MLRVNSDLIGKFVNIASRAAGFLTKRFDGRLTEDFGPTGSALLADVRAAGDMLAQLYEARDTGKVTREVMLLADKINAYVDQNKPWTWPRTWANSLALHQVARCWSTRLTRWPVTSPRCCPGCAGGTGLCGPAHERVECAGQRAGHRALPAPDAAGGPQAA